MPATASASPSNAGPWARTSASCACRATARYSGSSLRLDRSSWVTSMAHRSRAAKLHLAEKNGQRHGRKRDQHEDPEGIHIREEGGLRLQLLANPADCLLVRLGQRAAMPGEIARYLLQRVLVLHARRERMLDQA